MRSLSAPAAGSERSLATAYTTGGVAGAARPRGRGTDGRQAGCQGKAFPSCASPAAANFDLTFRRKPQSEGGFAGAYNFCAHAGFTSNPVPVTLRFDARI